MILSTPHFLMDAIVKNVEEPANRAETHRDIQLIPNANGRDNGNGNGRYNGQHTSHAPTFDILVKSARRDKSGAEFERYLSIGVLE